MTNDERLKSECSSLSTCEALERFIQDPDSKGIVQWDFVNLETLEHTRSIIGYKSSAKDKGVAFNYCPWCGGDLANGRITK